MIYGLFCLFFIPAWIAYKILTYNALLTGAVFTLLIYRRLKRSKIK